MAPDVDKKVVLEDPGSPTRPGSGNRPRPPLVVEPDRQQGTRQEVRRLPLLEAGSEALRGFGQRLDPMLECLGRFLGELRTSMVELSEAVVDESKARLQRRIKTGSDILEWAQAVHDDLCIEIGWAGAGAQRLALRTVLEEVAAEVETAELRVAVVPGKDQGILWAEPGKLRTVVALLLHITGKRIGGEGLLSIEIEAGDGVVRARIAGHGEPRSINDPRSVERLIDLARAGLGGAITPDDLGPEAAVLVLTLPSRPEHPV